MNDHLVVALRPSQPLDVIVMQPFRLLLKGLGIVGEGDQFPSLHDLERNVGILGQGSIAPAANLLDKLALNDEVRAGDAANPEQVPDTTVLDPLGNDNLLVNALSQEILLRIAGLVPPKDGNVAFRIFQCLPHQEIEGIGFWHCIGIVDPNVVAMSYFKGIVKNPSLGAGSGPFNNFNIAAAIARISKHPPHLINRLIRTVIRIEEQFHPVCRVVHIKDCPRSLGDHDLLVMGGDDDRDHRVARQWGNFNHLGTVFEPEINSPAQGKDLHDEANPDGGQSDNHQYLLNH